MTDSACRKRKLADSFIPCVPLYLVSIIHCTWGPYYIMFTGADKSKNFPLAHRTSEKENHLSGRKTCLPRFFFQK